MLDQVRLELAQNAAVPAGTPLWWLSFVDPAKSAPREEQVPGGGGFLGVIIVPGPEFMDAIFRINLAGINPGGAVKGIPLPPDGAPPEKMWRLLSLAEIEAWESGEESGGDAST